MSPPFGCPWISCFCFGGIWATMQSNKGSLEKMVFDTTCLGGIDVLMASFFGVDLSRDHIWKLTRRICRCPFPNPTRHPRNWHGSKIYPPGHRLWVESSWFPFPKGPFRVAMAPHPNMCKCHTGHPWASNREEKTIGGAHISPLFT